MQTVIKKIFFKKKKENICVYMYSIDIEMVIMFSVSKTLDPEIKGPLTHVSVLSDFFQLQNE